MAVNKVKANNTTYSPDANGIVDLGTVLKTHQSLGDCMKTSQFQVVTQAQWNTIKSNPTANTFYFVIEA